MPALCQPVDLLVGRRRDALGVRFADPKRLAALAAHHLEPLAQHVVGHE